MYFREFRGKISQWDLRENGGRWSHEGNISRGGVLPEFHPAASTLSHVVGSPCRSPSILDRKTRSVSPSPPAFNLTILNGKRDPPARQHLHGDADIWRPALNCHLLRSIRRVGGSLGRPYRLPKAKTYSLPVHWITGESSSADDRRGPQSSFLFLVAMKRGGQTGGPPWVRTRHIWDDLGSCTWQKKASTDGRDACALHVVSIEWICPDKKSFLLTRNDIMKVE